METSLVTVWIGSLGKSKETPCLVLQKAWFFRVSNSRKAGEGSAVQNQEEVTVAQFREEGREMSLTRR